MCGRYQFSSKESREMQKIIRDAERRSRGQFNELNFPMAGDVTGALSQGEADPQARMYDGTGLNGNTVTDKHHPDAKYVPGMGDGKAAHQGKPRNCGLSGVR